MWSVAKLVLWCGRSGTAAGVVGHAECCEVSAVVNVGHVDLVLTDSRTVDRMSKMHVMMSMPCVVLGVLQSEYCAERTAVVTMLVQRTGRHDHRS